MWFFHSIVVRVNTNNSKLSHSGSEIMTISYIDEVFVWFISQRWKTSLWVILQRNSTNKTMPTMKEMVTMMCIFKCMYHTAVEHVLTTEKRPRKYICENFSSLRTNETPVNVIHLGFSQLSSGMIQLTYHMENCREKTGFTAIEKVDLLSPNWSLFFEIPRLLSVGLCFLRYGNTSTILYPLIR